MKQNIVKEKSFDFALQIIKTYKFLFYNHKEAILSKQLLRSGTSIGAMVREAEHAESKADFIHKLAIAQKEANEVEYWIELLYRSDYFDEKMYTSLIQNIQGLNKIIASILITAKKNLKKNGK
jgi:four helix bundle protein